MFIRSKIRMEIEKQWRAGYPPGYDCRQEWQVAGLLFGISVVFSFQFFVELYAAYRELLSMPVNFERRIVEGATARPFMWLMEGRMRMFIPFFLFLGGMAIYHYFYYYQGTKSIYLMRRLPNRSTMIKSCMQGSLLCMGAGMVAIAVLYLLYFLVYLLVIPAECLPRWG